MKKYRHRKKPIAAINVVPYIDVMLVLLVVFMITAPLITQGVAVELPQANAQAMADSDKQPIIVSVDSEGAYYLNIAENPQKKLSAEDLVTRISAELLLAQRSNQTRPVMVKGDQNANYGKVVTAMVLLQQAGVKGVGLITEPPATTA